MKDDLQWKTTFIGRQHVLNMGDYIMETSVEDVRSLHACVIFYIFKCQKEFSQVYAFTRDLENYEVPGWPRDFRPELTCFGFFFGFDSCCSRFEVPDFILVPVLELFRTSWFCTIFWKPTFVCSLVRGKQIF